MTPQLRQIARELSSHVCGMGGETFELDETDSGGGEPTFEAYGRTHDGVAFGIRVRVEEVWPIDP